MSKPRQETREISAEADSAALGKCRRGYAMGVTPHVLISLPAPIVIVERRIHIYRACYGHFDSESKLGLRTDPPH